MTYRDTVAQAPSPLAAMLALAEGIDAILAAIEGEKDAIASDPWGSWNTVEVKRVLEEHGVPGFAVEPAAPVAPVAEQLAAIREALATETDAENRMALEARERLLTDPGELPFSTPEGARAAANEDGVVDLPPAAPERQAVRAQWAQSVSLGSMLDPPRDDDEAAGLYGKGGPMWLYLGYRDCVMGLPEQWRRMMVEDVERDSPVQAQELARDILKDFEANTPDVTIETMANQHAAD